jgi:hypothetical protein
MPRSGYEEWFMEELFYTEKPLLQKLFRLEMEDVHLDFLIQPFTFLGIEIRLD